MPEVEDMPKDKDKKPNGKKVRDAAYKLALAGMGAQMWERFEAEAMGEYCLELAQTLFGVDLEDED